MKIPDKIYYHLCFLFARIKGRSANIAKAANPLAPNKLIEIIVPNPTKISIKKAIFKFLYFNYFNSGF